MKDLENAQTISATELNQRMAAVNPPIVIDTLIRDRYEAVHIKNARQACVFEVTFLEQVAEIVPRQESQIVVYGSSEKTMDAAIAADKLLRTGYPNVLVLEGGLAAWRSAGFPLSGNAPDGDEAPAPGWILPEGAHTLDLDNSVVEWAGRNPNAKHHGTVGLAGGEVTVKAGGITGSFEIDMSTIENINLQGDELLPVLIDHLKSDDFFFVERYPSVRFTIENATRRDNPQQGLPNYDVKGILELKGVRAELEFPATVSVTAENHISAEAHFDIDRTRWNVIYGSSRFFEHLGMHLVFDLISFQVKIMTA